MPYKASVGWRNNPIKNPKLFGAKNFPEQKWNLCIKNR